MSADFVARQSRMSLREGEPAVRVIYNRDIYDFHC